MLFQLIPEPRGQQSLSSDAFREPGPRDEPQVPVWKVNVPDPTLALMSLSGASAAISLAWPGVGVAAVPGSISGAERLWLG